MKILFINTTCGIGSHGRICVELAEHYEKQGYECKIAYGRGCSEKYKKKAYKIGSILNIYFDVLITRLFDAHEYSCVIATKRFLRWVDSYNPDVLWLHNIHGYFINYKMLFDWIKSKPNLIVKWTLHDAWAFTGHCGVFLTENCEKWKTGCERCPLLWDYPESKFFDGSQRNYIRKKRAFSDVNNLTLITPSYWLSDMVKLSFLKNYPIEVRNNKVDSSIFKPTPSDFREKYNIVDKYLILGVANVWPALKGFDDFVQLAKLLDDNYVIALVGISNRQINDFSHKYNGFIRLNDFNDSVGIFSFSVSCSKLIEEKPSVMYNDGASASFSPEDKYESCYGVAISQDVKSLYREIVFRYPSKCSSNGGCKIILLNRTSNSYELAGLYTSADVYVNPSHGDNYPTTNLEARSCGTFVITYDIGGSKETISEI